MDKLLPASVPTAESWIVTEPEYLAPNEVCLPEIVALNSGRFRIITEVDSKSEDVVD